MERNFYNEEFEDLIRQKAGQYKMYPSDKVWKSVHASLHTRKRWFIAGMFTLISAILFIAGKELILPSGHPGSEKKAVSPGDNRTAANNNPSSDNNSSAVAKVVSLPITPAFTEFKPEAAVAVTADHSSILLSLTDSMINAMIAGNPMLIAMPAENNAAEDANNEPGSKWLNRLYAQKMELITLPGQPEQTGIQDPGSLAADQKNIIDHSSSTGLELDKKQMETLQNSAPYELVSPRKLNRKYWEFYVSPTVTYRSLTGAAINSSKSDVQNGPIAANTQDANPNLYTNNKPALGFEVGSSFLYRFTRNLSLKAGLQFNYSRYIINAYASNTQPAIIALSFNGYPGNTIMAYSNIGTIGGKAAVNLQNQYYQLSLPVGFELRVIGNEKLQLNIGATVQPSYLLNRDSYLLSSDYANYTQEPTLFRRWNINGAVEAFVSYKIGKIRWQVGPQFRYQLLSTYTNAYPLNENLKGLGIKLGISKSIW